jgi:nucleotide-binding universal stress UspA family protein
VIPRYERVLVTTDFSKLGNAAIPHAYALLGGQPGMVVLCHVLELPPQPNPLYAHYSPRRALPAEERKALMRKLEEELLELVPAGLPRGVKTDARVVAPRGAVHESIVDLVGSVRAKAVVIASHGHSGLARVYLGSTAERVLRASKVPVLVVRS